MILAGVLVAVLVAGMWSPARDPQPVPLVREAFDCQPRMLARIPSGTRIDNGPPKGYTHLISKSLPRLTGEDAGKLHPRAAELASLLFTSIVARAEDRQTSQGTTYRLAEVAIGVGAKVHGEDTILDSQTQSQLGANLGFLERCVLTGAERELDNLRVVARSATTMIVDMPSTLFLDGQHRSIVTRYVFMVNPVDGRLEVVLWRLDLDADGGYRLAPKTTLRRTLGRVEDVPLHVDASYTLAGLPTPKAFAPMQTLRGTPLVMPRSLSTIAAAKVLTPAMAEQIDTEMRRAVGFWPR
jgi:hypothetical protein